MLGVGRRPQQGPAAPTPHLHLYPASSGKQAGSSSPHQQPRRHSEATAAQETRELQPGGAVRARSRSAPATGGPQLQGARADVPPPPPPHRRPGRPPDSPAKAASRSPAPQPTHIPRTRGMRGPPGLQNKLRQPFAGRAGRRAAAADQPSPAQPAAGGSITAGEQLHQPRSRPRNAARRRARQPLQRRSQRTHHVRGPAGGGAAPGGSPSPPRPPPHGGPPAPARLRGAAEAPPALERGAG